MSNQNKRKTDFDEEENNANKAARNDDDEEEEEEQKQQEQEEQEEILLDVSNPIPTTKYKIPGYIITGTYTSNKNTVQEYPLPTKQYNFNIKNKNVTLEGAPENTPIRYLLIGKTAPREDRSGKFISTFTYFYPNENRLKKMDKKLDEASSSSSAQEENTNEKKYQDEEDIASINFLVRSMRNTSINDFDEQFENSTRLGGKRRKTRKNRKSRKSRKSRKNRKSRKL